MRHVMKISIVMFLFIFMIFGFQCGPKIKPQSELDNPEYHFKLGMRQFDEGKLSEAKAAFERAISLDKKYENAYGGLALVYAQKMKYAEAYKEIEKGLFYNEKNAFLWICKGRIITSEARGKNWIEDAEKAFEKALKYSPDDESVYYFRGLAYKKDLKFGKASSDFQRVISMKGEYASKADAEWEKIQKIQRAAPGTIAGKKVALIDEIDRADLAVLFAEELGVSEFFKKTQETSFTPGYVAPGEMEKASDSGTDIVDIKNHFAKQWIQEVVDLGIMELYPGKRFLPDQKVTRANFAMAIQNILIGVTGNEELATMYIGQSGGPSDVDPTTYSYNAIRLCLDRGVMKVDLKTGRFKPNETVSGADALLIIRQLENALK